MQNYVLQNILSYADSSRNALRILGDYFAYLLISAPGIVIATATFAGLESSLAHTTLMQNGGASAFYARLSCQFAAVLFGVWTSGMLKKVLTRTQVVTLDLASPETSPNPDSRAHIQELRPRSVPDLAPEAGE